MPIQKYRAQVSNIDDPEKLGRFKVVCPELLLNSNQELPHWIEHEVQHGWFTVPYLGQQIIIEIDKNEENEDELGIQNFVMGMIIKWKGEVPFTNKDYEKPYILDDKFKVNYPKRRGYMTKKGHCIIFDETDGDEPINIIWKNKTKESSIIFDKTGSIILEDSKENVVFLNASNDTIDIKHHLGSEVKLSATSIDITATNITSEATVNNTISSDSITNVNGLVVNIEATGPLNVKGATVVIDADLLQFKPGAFRPLLKSPEFCAIFDAHMHTPPGNAPTPFTGTPLVPITPLILTFTEPTILS